MRTHLRSRWSAAAVAAALLAAACGGDDDAGDNDDDAGTAADADADGASTTAQGDTAPAPTEPASMDGTAPDATAGATSEPNTAATTGATADGTAPAGAATGIDPELVAAAEAEGTVTVYSFTSRITGVEEAFEAAYPAIDLIGVDITSTEQIARITAEVDAGNPGADVAYITDAPVVLTELVEGGYLEPYVPETAADALPDEYETPLAAQRLSTKVLMYNEEAYPDGSPVTNLWELTTDEWTGQVVLVDPLQRGDYLDLFTQIALADDEMAAAYEAQFGEPVDDAENAGEAWIEALLGNDAVLTDDTDNVNAAIGAVGQDDPPVGFTSYSDRRDNEDEGWALQVAEGVEPAPGIAFPAFLALVEGAANPNAGKLLIEFMFGDGSETGGPAYEPFYVPGDYATRDDIAPHPDAMTLDELGAWVIDPQEIADARQDVADLVLANL